MTCEHFDHTSSGRKLALRYSSRPLSMKSSTHYARKVGSDKSHVSKIPRYQMAAGSAKTGESCPHRLFFSRPRAWAYGDTTEPVKRWRAQRYMQEAEAKRSKPSRTLTRRIAGRCLGCHETQAASPSRAEEARGGYDAVYGMWFDK